MDVATSRELCATAAIQIGLAVRHAVQALPLATRITLAPSALKPAPALSALPDVVGEQAAFKLLATLSASLGCRLAVLVDPAAGDYVSIGGPGPEGGGSQGGGGQGGDDHGGGDHRGSGQRGDDHGEGSQGGGGQGGGRQGGSSQGGSCGPGGGAGVPVVYVYLDAVDGTVKVRLSHGTLTTDATATATATAGRSVTLYNIGTLL